MEAKSEHNCEQQVTKKLASGMISLFATMLAFIGCVDDSSDEDESLFECDNGNNIPWNRVNDGIIDCTDGSDEDGRTKIDCDETKPIFSNEQENVVADYVYRFREEPLENPYRLHLDDNGLWDSSNGLSLSYTNEPGMYLTPVGICNFKILETEDTGKCVDYANSITYVKISYNMQHPGQQYSLTQMEGYYTVAKSNENGQWGVFPEGDFPLTYDCTVTFGGISGHSIDSDNDGIDILVNLNTAYFHNGTLVLNRK